MEKKTDDFIMFPTVDVCFKGLMHNPKVRKGFIAALLGRSPNEIEDTTLLPTILQPEYTEDKLGILDVRVRLRDGIQIDMEMRVAYFAHWDARSVFYLSKMFVDQLKKGESYEKLKKCIHVSILDFIYFEDDTECYRKVGFCDQSTGQVYTDLMEIQVLELRKIPKEVKSQDKLLNWMRFLSGKSREEFEDMAKTSEYLDEAYQELQKLSADDRARLEYEAREKAIRDYNSQISSSLQRGIEQGVKQGIERGIKQGKQEILLELTRKKLEKGMGVEEIACLLEEDQKVIRELAQKIQEEGTETGADR